MSLALPLLLVVALSLAMVAAMVRFSRALLAPSPRRPGSSPIGPRGGSPAARWGLLYAVVWAALIAAFLYLLAATGAGWSRRNLLLLAAVAGAWWTLHGALIAFARALARVGSPPPGRFPGEPESAAPDPLEGSGISSQETAESAATPPPVRRRGAWLAELAATLAAVAVAILLIAVGQALPGAGAVEAWFVAHRGPLLAVVLAAAGAGFVLSMGGALHLLLTAGRPADRREIEGLARRTFFIPPQRPALGRGAAVRLPGTSVGAAGHDRASFAEVKTAWKLRAWRVSRRWRRMFVMLAGAVLLTVGLFGSAIVLAPFGLKLLLGGALLYAAVRTAAAFRAA